MGSYHLFADRDTQMKTLKAYEVCDAEPRDNGGEFRCAFHLAVNQMVVEHFAGKGPNAHKCKTSHKVWHFCVQLTAIAAMWAAFTRESYFAGLVAASCMAHLIFNVAHEASHNAFCG